MKHYRFILNGIVREIYAKNLLMAFSNIATAYPECAKMDYRELKITEIND